MSDAYSKNGNIGSGETVSSVNKVYIFYEGQKMLRKSSTWFVIYIY